MENLNNNFQPIINHETISTKEPLNESSNNNFKNERPERVFNKIIYPHIDRSQQRKTTKFIFCYYANVVDLRRFNDDGFNKFNNHLISFIMKSNFDKLIGPEEVYNSKTRNLRKHFTRTDGELSCFWEYMYINREQKQNIDKFLLEVFFMKF